MLTWIAQHYRWPSGQADYFGMFIRCWQSNFR